MMCHGDLSSFPYEQHRFQLLCLLSATARLFPLSRKGLIFANQRNGSAAHTSVPEQGAGNKG